MVTLVGAICVMLGPRPPTAQPGASLQRGIQRVERIGAQSLGLRGRRVKDGAATAKRFGLDMADLDETIVLEGTASPALEDIRVRCR